MGVPKFFRFISERYPCLSELAREQSIPEFDNLYLDMNGIIHNCSHPDDSNVHFSITEDDMFKDIFSYIDKLFFLIKPQKLFFMAVDGVAPRAKMNQQRSRRFRSANESKLLETQAKNRGETIGSRFDSNCITPGTEFMSRLHEGLRYFIKSKISADPLWQKCRVILSGHDSPGEGEHKIMDYIRFLKSQKNFNPNTRHCLYGLDADLIILGLCTHEHHFVVLREEVKFGRKAKRTSVEETRFFLLHLGLLRDYIELEFNSLRETNESFNISKLIDDWILMGFLVGNDFVPHLPFLHISSNALPLLYKTYMRVYPEMGGNINENGQLNLKRLEMYFQALSDVEFELFQEGHADLKYFDPKKTKNGIDEAFDFDVDEIKMENVDNDLANLIESSRMLMEDNDDDDDDDSLNEGQHIVNEFMAYKRNYYLTKLKYNEMTPQLKKEQAVGYITALQWILDYYYKGVQSWDWYFPQHYAPFISDITNFKDYKIHFNLGKPFLPFEQLLGVLPSASKELLPLAYRKLMTSPDSELIHFYPEEFDVDLNGKRHDWEAVVLIPFIDEKLLLRAMKSCERDLTPSERRRNTHGSMYQYDYNSESQGNVPGIYSLKTLNHVFCTEKSVWPAELAVPRDFNICVDLDNAAHHVFVPGFPTMKHLKYSFQVRYARVKVFEQNSRNESFILLPKNQTGHDDIFTVAENFLNQIVYIGWPHLMKAKVVAISNAEKFIDSEGIRDVEKKLFQLHTKTAQEHFSSRMGIQFESLNVMIHVKTHVGSTYSYGSQGKIILSNVWNDVETVYPAQGIVSQINLCNSNKIPYKKIENLFPINSTIFFVGNPYFGSEGTVLNPLLVYECGRLKVSITVLPEPDFTEAKQLQNELESDYVNSFQAAYKIGIQHKCLSKITGTLLVISGPRRSNIPDNTPKINIGLQFKFPKQQEERIGFARRVCNTWLYSTKAIDLVQLYYEKYPMVFHYISNTANNSNNDFCFETDLLPTYGGEPSLKDISNWLKQQIHYNADRVPCGSKTIEKESAELVLQSIEKLKTLPVKTVKLQVKPHLLLKPDVSLPDMYKPKRPIRMFDRVVIVKTTYMVPLGSKGTVIGIHPVTDPNPVRLECLKNIDYFLEVLFDKNIPNASDIHGIAEERVVKVPQSSLLLIFIQDNNKPNDHCSDQKFTQFIDENKSSSISTSAPILGDNVLNNNESLNTKEIITYINLPIQSANNKEKYNNITTNEKIKSTTSAVEDFWMPSQNKKIKNCAAIVNPTTASPTAVQQQLLQAINYTSKASVEKNVHADTATPKKHQETYPQEQQQQLQEQDQLKQIGQQVFQKDHQAGTELLRNLLGLRGESTKQSEVQQSPQQQQQQTLENKHSICGQSQQLPQPPPCWRSEALQNTSNTMQYNSFFNPNNQNLMPNCQNNFNSNMRSMGITHPQYYAPNITYYPSQMHPPLQLMHTPIQQQMHPLLQQPFYPPQQQQMYAQKDNFRSAISLSQKGAFIPIQALRNNYTTTKQSTANDIAKLDEQVKSCTLNSTSNFGSPSTSARTNRNAPDPSSVVTANKQQQAISTKRRPRVPKIGAKFDNV